MEKMSTTIYILTVLGALLVPTFAEDVTSNVTANVSMTTTPGSIPLNMTSLMAAYNESDADEEFPEISTIASTAMPREKDDTPDTPVSDATTKKGVHTYGPSTNKPKIVIINRSTQASTVPHEQKSDKSVYFIVLLIVIFGVAVIGIIFFCAKSNSRRFSVDMQAKNEDAHIPLASVEPEEKSSPTDTMEKAKEKALVEADQQDKESPLKTTEAPAEKLADPTDVDVNDGDPTASTKTSVETLNDVLNDNNSNNNAVSDVNVCFIEICLNE